MLFPTLVKTKPGDKRLMRGHSTIIVPWRFLLTLTGEALTLGILATAPWVTNESNCSRLCSLIASDYSIRAGQLTLNGPCTDCRVYIMFYQSTDVHIEGLGEM